MAGVEMGELADQLLAAIRPNEFLKTGLRLVLIVALLKVLFHMLFGWAMTSKEEEREENG